MRWCACCISKYVTASLRVLSFVGVVSFVQRVLLLRPALVYWGLSVQLRSEATIRRWRRIKNDLLSGKKEAIQLPFALLSANCFGEIPRLCGKFAFWPLLLTIFWRFHRVNTQSRQASMEQIMQMQDDIHKLKKMMDSVFEKMYATCAVCSTGALHSSTAV